MSFSAPSDQEAFERIRAGDRDAFEVLFRTHYSELHRFARAHLSDATEAEDAVQDVFLRIWRDRERLVTTAPPRTYLLAAVRNRVIDLLRRRVLQRRWIDRVDSENAASSGERSPRNPPISQFESDPASVVELEAAIRRAVADLPERSRTAFLLCRQQELSYAEAAEIMGVSPSTVKTHMARSLASLRLALHPFLSFVSFLYVAIH
jgi:RNA polymerase sigma-70 factor (ECF subfamily)